MSKLIFLIALLIVTASADDPPRKLDENRIFGGHNFWIEDYPYQVSLEAGGEHYCGGSIISDKYVLTAGHCIEDLNAQDVKVRVGSTWREKGGALYQAGRLILHEKYGFRDDGVPINDIALIELTKSIVFGKTHKPIELFKTNEKVPRGAKGVVSGWGATDKHIYLGQLQSVSIPIISQAQCKKAYSQRPGQLVPYVPDGQICAGYLGTGGKDTCQGDSGGPLAIEGRLAGVVSWGEGCANPDFPGAYTEVAYYHDWIKRHTGL